MKQDEKRIVAENRKIGEIKQMYSYIDHYNT